tara:strand:- start:310 stop:705 length:396 start_codon:yes stop_codon:yes gene_type:complete
MKLRQPIIITPRLLAGIRIGSGFVSIDYSPREGDFGRTRYEYHIDGPDWDHTGDDLQSGCNGGDLIGGLGSLLSFLGACGDALDYEECTGCDSENSDLFPKHVAEWCSQNSDELSMASCEIQESDVSLITE